MIRARYLADLVLLALLAAWHPLAPVALIVGAYAIGTRIDTVHRRRLVAQETSQVAVPAHGFATGLHGAAAAAQSYMVAGSAVISIDRFRHLFGRLRGVFGGSQLAYESLVDRARREALQRMRAQAPDAIEFACVRVETADIGYGAIEAIAYGTAIVRSA